MSNLQNIIAENEKLFTEKGAGLEHDRWAKWQKYLHSKLKYVEYEIEDGVTMAGYLMDAGDYEHWSRQIDTSYSELSEPEKESDRKETRNYLPLFNSSQLRLIEGFREMVREKSLKYGSDNEIDAVSVDLLSELGSINEIK